MSLLVPESKEVLHTNMWTCEEDIGTVSALTCKDPEGYHFHLYNKEKADKLKISELS